MKLPNLEFRKAYLAVSGAIIMSGIICGTKCLANPFGQNEATLRGKAIPVSSAELDAATRKVEESKAKLEQAHKQLTLARALVRAAEAEFKAAKVDKQALALRTEAQKLADVSKTTESTVQQPVEPIGPGSMVDLGNTRLKGWQVPAQVSQQAVQSQEVSQPSAHGAPAPSTPQDKKEDQPQPVSIP
jgi:hypothetical protein